MFSKKWQLFAGVRMRASDEWTKRKHEFITELVKFLVRKESRLNRLQKIWCLLFFIGFCSGACVYILYDTFQESPKSTLHIEAIKQPVLPPHGRRMLTAQDTATIKVFKSLIDSLGQSAEGRKQLEDYSRRHPGLLDSFDKMQKNIR